MKESEEGTEKLGSCVFLLCVSDVSQQWESNEKTHQTCLGSLPTFGMLCKLCQFYFWLNCLSVNMSTSFRQTENNISQIFKFCDLTVVSLNPC